MRLLLLIQVSLGLVACVMITMPAIAPLQTADTSVTQSRQALSIPELAPVPDVPDIPPAIAKDRSKTEDILVAKIKELRDYGKYANEVVEQMRQERRTSCH